MFHIAYYIALFPNNFHQAPRFFSQNLPLSKSRICHLCNYLSLAFNYFSPTNENKSPYTRRPQLIREQFIYSNSMYQLLQITPNISGLKQYLLSHNFCRSGILVQFIWVFCFKLSHWLQSRFQLRLKSSEHLTGEGFTSKFSYVVVGRV